MAGLLLNRRDSGVFSVALMLGEGMFLFAGAINLAFYPSVAASMNPRDYTRRTAVHMLWLCGLVGVTLGIMARFAVPLLLGPGFAPSVPAFFWMLPGLVLLGGEQVIASYFAATFMPWPIVGSIAFGVGLGSILAVLLSAEWGLRGVAVATAAAQLCAALGVLAKFVSDSRRIGRNTLGATG